MQAQTARASHFYWSPEDFRCGVWFGNSYMNGLDELNQKLSDIPGAKWEEPRQVGDGDDWAGCLICPSDKVEATIKEAKAILKPVLAVTVTKLELCVRCCGANNKNDQPGRPWNVTPTYMPGMEPAMPLNHIVKILVNLWEADLQRYILPPSNPEREAMQQEGERLLVERFAISDGIVAHLQQVVFIPQYCCLS